MHKATDKKCQDQKWTNPKKATLTGETEGERENNHGLNNIGEKVLEGAELTFS